MIELSPNTALMAYLGFTLVCLLGAWLYHLYRSKRKPVLPSEQELHVCEFCHFAYLAEGGKRLTRCPRCNSYNNHK